VYLLHFSETAAQLCLHCADLPQVGRASFDTPAEYDDFLNAIAFLLNQYLAWNDERTNAMETSVSSNLPESPEPRYRRF
jgi:hypothetical protein